jgi:hypothetical protein
LADYQRGGFGVSGGNGEVKDPALRGCSCEHTGGVFTVVEHFAVHTGQIMFVTKQMTHHDLGDISRSKKVK